MIMYYDVLTNSIFQTRLFFLDPLLNIFDHFNRMSAL